MQLKRPRPWGLFLFGVWYEHVCKSVSKVYGKLRNRYNGCAN
jgi:hypothetical protein